jgi:hypothetical protein
MGKRPNWTKKGRHEAVDDVDIVRDVSISMVVSGAGFLPLAPGNRWTTVEIT